MASERKIITAAIQSREAFEKVETFVQEGDFTEQGALLWKHIRDYYSRDRACGSVDVETLHHRVGASVSSEKHRTAFTALINEIAGARVSPENIVHDFLSLKREGIGAKLATALLSGEAEESRKLLEEYNKWDAEVTEPSSEESGVLVAPSLEEITKTYDSSELIKLWPSSLNNRLDGGLLRGHHVVVFARPEMGKTLFLINAVAGFLAQGLVVLYVGNEDPITDIVLRVVCRLTRRDKFTVLADPKDAYATALTFGYGNLVLAGLSPGTPKEIEKLIEHHRPDILIIDQLRNLNVGSNAKNGNYTQQLEQAATAARNLGKKHDVLVLSVTQAGDSASGKAVLDMGDVDSSNTGIPAQADVMVGIGATQEDEQVGRRIISLPKNKRSGKHEFFPVRIDPQLSRIINLEGADNT